MTWNEKDPLAQEIEAVLDREVRPALALHGGNICSLDCSDDVYRFRLTGHCAGCPSAALTSEQLVRSVLLKEIPGLRDAVLTANVSDDLLSQAKAILEGRLR